MRISLPEEYPSGVCILVPIDRALVPFVAGALDQFVERRLWETESYEMGYRAFTELAATMTALCVTELIESNDRLYRLLNQAMYGQSYEVVTEDPLVITPAIPLVPAGDIAGPSLLYNTDAALQLIDNSLNGTETGLYAYTPSVKDLLQSVIDSLAASGSADADQLEQLIEIVALLGA